MLNNIYIGIVLVTLLSLADYVSEGRFKNSRIKEKIVSLGAGISITYIFLHLFPTLYLGTQELSRFLFIFVLLGFTIYHLVEKYIYQHAPRDKIVHEIETEHSIALFSYHFIIGIVLISMIKVNIMDGTLFFFPILFHIIIDALPHSRGYQRKSVKLFFSSAALLGAFLAIIIPIPEVIKLVLVGIVAGLLLFLETREIIPVKRKGKPFYFLAGMVVYGTFIVITWFI